MRLGDRVSHSDTRIVKDWSVTFRHQDSKENESWIMLIYSGLKNLFPKWVWCGGLSPHKCAWCCGQWLWYLLLSPVEYGSRFYIIIRYILLSFLSWPMIPTQYLCLVLTPTCNFLLCYLWSAANVPSTSTHLNSRQSSSRQISGWAIVPSSDWILSHSCLDVLEVRTWTICFLILAS